MPYRLAPPIPRHSWAAERAVTPTPSNQVGPSLPFSDSKCRLYRPVVVCCLAIHKFMRGTTNGPRSRSWGRPDGSVEFPRKLRAAS